MITTRDRVQRFIADHVWRNDDQTLYVHADSFFQIFVPLELQRPRESHPYVPWTTIQNRFIHLPTIPWVLFDEELSKEGIKTKKLFKAWKALRLKCELNQSLKHQMKSPVSDRPIKRVKRE
jgi:hypothetical protein